MSSSDRSPSRDRTALAKQAHSLADNGRASVPMWDSSDPERAPPPLPLNPGSQSPTTRANTSSAIAAAAQQIIERARESTPISSYTSNVAPLSPDRSLVKGSHHKRMQSLQTSSVKDLRSYIDSNRSPEKSPERPASSNSFVLYGKDNTREYTMERSPTPTPSGKDLLKDTPALRPTTRPPPRPILGENTPPSSTMLALQTMKVPDDAFNDIHIRPGTPSTPRPNTTYDFSSQLLNLTSIATNLQKEMAAISRRSKDNATDLLSLKEATLMRDEDIRKSLKDLATNVTASSNLAPQSTGNASRNASSLGGLFLDSKAFGSPPSAAKPYTIPRVSSVPNFGDDRIGSPSPYSVEGAASVAMLEKIIREMVTKEGQERLLGTLSELFEKSSKDNVQAAKKVEQLADFIKEKSASSALVPVGQTATGAPRLDLSFDSPSNGRSRGVSPVDTSSAPNDEVLKLFQRIKESISHSGGVTAEVKGLVRDMRGEVLGMGRELGRKLDQVSEAQLNTSLDRSIADTRGQSNDEVYRIVEEGLNEIKAHLTEALDHHGSRIDAASKQLTVAPPAVDSDQIYSAVKHALVEHGETNRSIDDRAPAIDHEGVLEAVKEGLKDFEPNIELQQFGLERDEILAVLKEGLEDYQRSKPEPSSLGIDKGELYEMMQEALKDFQPGQRIRDEILSDVRTALADFQASSHHNVADDVTRLAIIEAIKDTLAEHGPAAPRELEISRDDLFDAVKSSLDGSAIPFNGLGEQVLQRLQEIVDGMHTEFKQYSAAGGRDTEQVLDAVKDGLECLRAEIESYVDRAQDVTGKDEIIDTVKAGLEQLRVDIQQTSNNNAGASEMLDYIKAEFEQLHESNSRSRELDEPSSVRSIDLLEALHASVDDLKSRDHARSINSEDETKDEVYEAMKEEFEQLKTAILHGHATDKSELIETIQDSLGALHSRFNGSELSSMSAQSTEELLGNIRQELSELKTSIVSSMDEGDRDAIVTGVKRSIDDLRVQLSADQSDASAETMGMMKEELERFREMMGSSVVLGGSNDQHESLVAIRENLEEVRELVSKHAGTKALPDDLLEALRGEFEILRTSVGSHSSSNEEVVDTIRVGLDDLRSSLEKKLDSPERNNAQQSELLDVMSEGLDTLRADVLKTLDKPLDMTVNYEILDALKEGFTSLRSELDILKPASPKAGQIVLAEGGVMGEATRDLGVDGTEPTAGSAAAKQLGLDKIEILLTQLQIKIEGLAASVHDGATRSVGADNTATRVDLEGIEAQLKELQETVLIIAERENSTAAPEGAATKADTDAIETLLRNTKSHLEDTIPQESGSLATKEHLESIESMVALTAEVMDSLKEKLDDTVAAKADVAVVEVLAQDMKTMLEEMKEKADLEGSDETRMTKADLDIIGILCTEIKVKITEMDLPAASEVASKADLEQLQGLIADFRESHDKLRDSYESDIAITAKAFDDRKDEFENTIKQIDEVKAAVMDAKDDLLQRLTHEDVGLEIIVDKLKSLEEKAFSGAMSLEVTEILETVKGEFEKTHTSVEALKVDHEHNAITALEKQGEHKEALVTEIGERLDTLFDGLMSKYDDAQVAAAEHAKALEEKSNSHEALFLSTKDMADDLKLSIDTLGTSMTAFTATYPDSMDKLVQDSKVVFNRVDDTYNKLDETQSGLQHEHTITRAEVQKVMTTLQALNSDLSEHNPRFMMSMREIQALVAQHYEHSQKASEAAELNTQAMRDLQQALKTGFEDAKGHTSSQTEAMRGALPALLPAPDSSSTDRAPYDDTAVHEKLDTLMGHVREANGNAPQLERLDQIHEKVMATAAEVSAFVALHSRQIEQSPSTEDAVILERRTAQRDQVEADIAVLDEEKEDLQAEIDALKHERDALLAQKMKAATELSSVETALTIRREELHSMETKAETIERRMLEGIMNQSRLLLLTKNARSQSPTKRKPQGRDLRIASNTSSISTMTSSTMPPLQANHSLAMKTRQPLSKGNQTPNTAERRIMSLSQINHNVPTGASAYAVTPTLVDRSSNGLKRSHSVKTGFMRKPSWASVGKNRRVSEFNKENEALSEEEEEDDDFHSVTHRDDLDELDSEAGTERRTSFATETDIDRSVRPSLAGSEMTFETGSYLTGSELDHRDSIGSSAAGVVDHDPEQTEAGAIEEPTQHMLQLDTSAEHKHVYAPPSDSGIGTDLPTAVLSPSEQSCFFK